MRSGEKLVAILGWKDFKGTTVDLVVMMESVELAHMQELQEISDPDLSLCEYLVKYGFARYAGPHEIELFVDADNPIKETKDDSH
jgi:hypothetical protein